MATVGSSKRHLIVTSDTYESNGNVVVGGDLTINGTTTTIDTANLLVEDKNIIIGNVSSPTDTTADGGGITLKGASDYTINWSNANNRWEFNQGIHSTGSITGSNLSGTNTGDQDLSGYALTGHNHNIWDLTATRSGINIDTVGNNNFWDYLHGTSTDDGTHVSSYQYVVSFGDESQGIQFSHTHGSGSNDLYFRAGSDNPSSENGANTYKNWRRVLTTSDEGSGNGLDADTLDSLQASSFLRSDANDTFTGTITGNMLYLGGSQITASSAKLQVNGFQRTGTIYLHEGTSAGAANYALETVGSELRWNTNKVWHAGNDGPSSGLDADTLDGQEASAFALTGHNHDGDYIQDGGTTAIGDINTIGTESIKHRWNNTTVGRPAEPQTNEYGTVTTLTYDTSRATQLAWDIDQGNLYGRTLDIANNSGTWKRFALATEIPTDFVSAANGGTFSGDVEAPGIYVGATNTSFDFYNNGTSYLNGATTVDAAFTQSGGGASSFSGNVSITGNISASNLSGTNTGDQDLSGYALTGHNHTSLTGVTNISFNAQSSDSASISTTINSTATYFDFNLTDDNNNDWWRWRFTPSGSTVYDAMTLKPASNGNANLTVSGNISADNLSGTNTGDQNLSGYLRSDANDTATGYITFSNSDGIVLDGNGSTPDSTTATYNQGLTIEGGNMRLNIDVSNVGNGGAYIQTRHESTTYPNAYYTLALNPLGGNVGIGTASPSQKLHVVGNARVTGAYYDSNNSPGTSNQVLVSTVTGTDWIDGTAIPGLVDGTGTANYVARWTGTESIGTGVIYDNGTNVGISATSLYSKLHIGNSSNGNNNLLTMESSGPVWVHLKTPSNNQSQIGFGESQYVDQNTRGRIVYNSSTTTANNYMSFTTNFAEVMRITNSNVGIGTTSPSNKLDVNGNIEASRIILPTAGTSGAGTVTVPAGKLDIRSDSTWSNSAIIARTTTNQNPVLAFYRPSGSAAISYPWWLEANGSTFQIKTGSAANIGSETVSTKVTINSSGNVGIGTTSPTQRLDVNGDIAIKNATQLSFDSNNGTLSVASHAGQLDLLSSSIFINYSSNVGIGTTTPSYLLEVSGSAAKSTGTTWINTSDERTKENIQNYTKGLNDIVQLQPRVFDYNGKGSTEKSKENIGLIAQEVIDVYPEAIGTFKAKLDETDAKETDIYNLDFHSISISMINAIKELNEKVKILETKIQTLENQ